MVQVQDPFLHAQHGQLVPFRAVLVRQRRVLGLELEGPLEILEVPALVPSVCVPLPHRSQGRRPGLVAVRVRYLGR